MTTKLFWSSIKQQFNRNLKTYYQVKSEKAWFPAREKSIIILAAKITRRVMLLDTKNHFYGYVICCHATWAHIHLTKRKSPWRTEIKPYSLRLFWTHVIKKYQSFVTTSQIFSILSVYKWGNTGYKGRLKTDFGLARFVGLSSRRKKQYLLKQGIF